MIDAMLMPRKSVQGWKLPGVQVLAQLTHCWRRQRAHNDWKRSQPAQRLPVAGLLAMLLLICLAIPAQAQIAFRSAASAGVASSAATSIAYGGEGAADDDTGCGNDISPSIPGGTSAGDFLVAVVVAREDSATVTMPGWNTLFAANVAGEEFQSIVFWRIATGADPNTISQSGTCDLLYGRISRFTGVDPINPIDAGPSASYQDTNSVSTGTISTTVASAMRVFTAHIADNATLNSTPAGFTQAYSVEDSSGRDGGISLLYGLAGGTASYGPYSANKNSGSDPNHGVLFALRPRGGGLTIPVPAGTVVGDVMIAGITARPCSGTSGGACTTTVTPPAGWTLINSFNQTTGAGTGGFGNVLYVYRRVATGAEPASYTWNFGGAPVNAGAAGGILSFSGVDTANPIIASAGQVTPSAGTHTAPSIDTGLVTNSMLVGSFSANSAATWTPPAGSTEAVDVPSIGVPDDLGLSIEINYEFRAAAGPTGTRSATQSTPPTNDTGATHMLALRPLIQAPALVSATAICGTSNQVEVLFSQAVTVATAQNAANYALNGGATVSSAILGADPRIVTLTTSTLANQLYTLTVNNVANSLGQTVPANSQATFFSEGGYLSGLLGTYYGQGGVQRAYFTGTTVTRVDGPLDFDWGGGIPVAGIGADDFSVIWNGFVTPSTSGNYTFRTRSDDGVRLYFDGNAAPIIDNWTDHGPTNNDSAVITLNAGLRYSVRMEFYERSGGAVAQLLWSGPSTGGFQFIPRSSLSHFCGLPRPAAFYTMDETSWNGTSDEVVDSSGNGRNGTAVGGAVPTLAKVCNGAQLDGASRYVTVGGLSGILNGTASLAFWIKTTQTGNDTGWQAPGVTGVELAGGSDDIFWGWLDAGGRIGISVANDFTTKSTVPINDGTWRHVVLTRDHVAGTYKIYIDGVLNASGTIAGGLIGTPFSSIGRIEDTGTTPEYLDGQLDEVRIYGQVLSDSEVVTVRDATRPCASTVDHYRVQHATSGINCQAENVTITAHTVAHAATSADGRTITLTADRIAGAAGTHGDYTLVTGTGSLANGTADDGVASYTFGSGESSVVLAYKNTWVQTVNFSVSDGIVSDLSGTASADVGYNQNIAFSPSGFRFVDSGGASLSDQIAGTSGGPFYLQAIQTGTGGCTGPGPCTGVCTIPTAFGNGATTTIDLAFQCNNPTTCQAGQQLSITNNGTTAIAANPNSGVSSYTSKALVFGANGQAAFNVAYPDVGAISLHARYDIPLGTGGASGNLMSAASNIFVVRPAGFTLSNIVRTADALANPAAADAGGTVFIRAGNDFSATVTAVNSLGVATPNYGKESSAETVRLTRTLVLPAGGNNPALQNATAFGAFNLGVATGTTFSWGEVGIITLTPEVGDGDYLGAGNTTGTVTGNVGRFIPFDFAATRNVPFFQSGCAAAGKDAFTYIGQPFTYQTAPVITVTARNSAGTTTQNYRASFWKITNSALTGMSYIAAAGTVDVSGIPGTDPAIIDNGNGTGTLTFSAGMGLKFARATPVVPFNAEIALSINVLDSDATTVALIDGVGSTNPVRFGQATAGNGIAFTGTTVTVGKTPREMRFGRLRMENMAGTSRLDLPLSIRAEYYGANGFLINADDSCTAFNSTDIAMDFSPDPNLAACETAIAPSGAVSLSNGVPTAGFRLRAPGTGNDGAVDLRINLAGAAGTTCTAVGGATSAATTSALDFLQGNWVGSGTYNQDPRARATFGIYKNANEFIYFQENF